MARGLGYRPDPYSSRDRPLSALMGSLVASPPPDRADLSPFVVDVLDQGSTSSCVAHSFAQAARMAMLIDGLPGELPSRLALYHWSRAEHGDTDSDAGTYLRSCCAAIRKFGLPPESVWPFDVRKVNEPPGWPAFRAGYDLRMSAKGYYRCYGLNDIRVALAADKPVVFGMMIGESFMDNDGPSTIDYDDGPHAGGHAMTCVGYEPGRFKIVNSWTTDWRDEGFAWLTERRLAQATDIWAVDFEAT